MEGNFTTILRCRGRIVLEHCGPLRHAVDRVRAENLVFDLEQACQIDAAGLGVLATSLQEARQGRRAVFFVNAIPAVKSALEITGLAQRAWTLSAIRDLRLDAEEFMPGVTQSKVIHASCPACGTPSTTDVSSYRLAMRTTKSKYFYCSKCGVEFQASLDQVAFSVATRPVRDLESIHNRRV